MKNYYNKIFHISFWVIKLGIIFYFFHWPYYGQSEIFWERSLFILGLHVAYFYSNYALLFPLFFEKKKYFLYILGLMYMTFLHYLGLMWVWDDFSSLDELTWKVNIPGATGASFIFFSTSFCWKLLENWVQSVFKRIHLEKDLKTAELHFLKSQINPHFLFNVLGCINGLALINSPETGKAIRDLKELINNAIKTETGKKIPLKNELEFIRSFINLHRIRYAVPVRVDFDESDIENCLIEPMLILPLVENAFKHGDLSETGKITAKAKVIKGVLRFSLENKIDENISVEASGIGDKNVRKRLKFAYPNQHDIGVSTSNGNYKVALEIYLKNE